LIPCPAPNGIIDGISRGSRPILSPASILLSLDQL
jgi:hypothetical protein